MKPILHSKPQTAWSGSFCQHTTHPIENPTTARNRVRQRTVGSGLLPGWLVVLLLAALAGVTRWDEARGATVREQVEADRTEAPYFSVEGAGRVDAFPVKSTAVKARVAGVVAEVEVVQRYANEAEEPLEAVYVFPGSTRAAVQGLEMRIGERRIVAKIHEKEAAKAGYEKAKAEKKQASLLEQERPNVFRMSVANIAPGAEVEVRLRYVEVLRPTERVYELVFPTVVGPRYTGAKGAVAEGPDLDAWAGNPYLNEGEASPMAFSFAMHLEAGLPVKSLTCASHEADIRFTSATAAELALRGGAAADRDVVVRYRLAEDQVATGLLLDRGTEGKDSHFLLQVQPPARVTPTQIPPREFLFIVDVSGSMNGFPIRTAQLLMADLLGGLRREDRFNVLTFAGGSELLSETSLAADEGSLARALEHVQRQHGSGGTELLSALQRALAIPRPEEGMARTVVLVTDGYVTVEREAFDLMRERLGEASFFTFGIGSSVNRHLLEGLARIGGGEPLVVTAEQEARAAAKRFQKYISAPVLTQVRVAFEGFEVSELLPETVPDVYADRPVLLAGKWRGEPRGRIKVSGLTAGRDFEAWIDVTSEAAKAGAMTNPALATFWAREKVRELSDYAGLGQGERERTRAEVTALGLKYGLLTEFTSFLAVDETPVPSLLAQTLGNGKTVPTVRQPLPLPLGVSGLAARPATVSITGNAGSTPEPGTMGLLMLSLAALWMQRRR